MIPACGVVKVSVAAAIVKEAWDTQRTQIEPERRRSCRGASNLTMGLLHEQINALNQLLEIFILFLSYRQGMTGSEPIR